MFAQGSTTALFQHNGKQAVSNVSACGLCALLHEATLYIWIYVVALYMSFWLATLLRELTLPMCNCMRTERAAFTPYMCFCLKLV